MVELNERLKEQMRLMNTGVAPLPLAAAPPSDDAVERMITMPPDPTAIEQAVRCKTLAVPLPKCAAAECKSLRALYEELLYAVAKKHPGETRHETALRYILERENSGASNRGAAAPEAVAVPLTDAQLRALGLHFLAKPVTARVNGSTFVVPPPMHAPEYEGVSWDYTCKRTP